MLTIGMHYIVDIFHIRDSIIKDTEYLFRSFTASLKNGSMNVVGEGLKHMFPNGGATFLCILQESHATLHSYPEYNYIALDIFVCAGKNPCKAIEHFIGLLNSEIIVEKKTIQRGQKNLEGNNICV